MILGTDDETKEMNRLSVKQQLNNPTGDDQQT